jgi:hypothetical protein
MGWVVNAKPRSLYPRERPGTHCRGGWVGPKAGLDRCGKSRLRSPDRPARSESLYRLSYPGPQVGNRNSQIYVPVLILQSTQYSLVSVVTGLRPGRSKIRIPSGAINFSPLQNVRLVPRFFPRNKAPGA